MDSRFEQHRRLNTPHWETIGYRPRDNRALREMGASGKIITEDQPELDSILDSIANDIASLWSVQ